MPKKKKAKKKEVELKEDEQFKLTPEPAKEADKKEHFIKLNIDEDMKQDIADKIMAVAEGQASDEEWQKFLKKLKYCEQRYEMMDYEDEWPWEGAAKRRTGDTTIATDRLMPRLDRALFYSGSIWDVEPEGNNTEDNAKKQSGWLDYTAREKMNIRSKTKNIRFDSVLANFGVGKLTYREEEEKREEVTLYESAAELLRNYPDALEKYPQYILKLTGYKTIEEFRDNHTEIVDEVEKIIMEDIPSSGAKLRLRETYKDVKSGNQIDWVEPKNMIFPKGITDEKKSWLIGERIKYTRDELLRKQEAGFFEGVEKIWGEEKEDDPGKEYEVIEAEIRYDTDKDGLNERSLVWIAKGASIEGKERSLFLRGVKFFYSHNLSHWRIVRSTLHRYGFYTGGLAEKMKSVNILIDRRSNQITNGWDQAIVRSWLHLKTPGSPYRPKIHKFFPGATIPIGQIGEMTEIKHSDIPPSSGMLLADGRKEGELLSGLPLNLMSGQVTPRDPDAPAKKSEILLAEGSVSASEYLKEMSEEFKIWAYMIQMNTYQFTDTTSINYKNNKGFEEISKQQMKAQAKFTNKTSIESIQATDKARSYLNFLNTMGQHPLISGNMSAQLFIVKNIIENWDEGMARNIDKILPEGIDVLVQQQIDQAKAAAQQAEAKKRGATEGEILPA